ncbi:hypothetical protein U1Q18_052169 [Sarracenia purpurea var. burkii]
MAERKRHCSLSENRASAMLKTKAAANGGEESSCASVGVFLGSFPEAPDCKSFVSKLLLFGSAEPELIGSGGHDDEDDQSDEMVKTPPICKVRERRAVRRTKSLVRGMQDTHDEDPSQLVFSDAFILVSAAASSPLNAPANVAPAK